jgi:hypothetical protein
MDSFLRVNDGTSPATCLYAGAYTFEAGAGSVLLPQFRLGEIAQIVMSADRYGMGGMRPPLVPVT